jgi:hypothetical protein
MKKMRLPVLINDTKTSGKSCGKATDLLGNHGTLTCAKPCGYLVENGRKDSGTWAEKALLHCGSHYRISN